MMCIMRVSLTRDSSNLWPHNQFMILAGAHKVCQTLLVTWREHFFEFLVVKVHLKVKDLMNNIALCGSCFAQGH